MATEHLQTIDDHIILYRDTDTGIAWVANGHTGLRHTPHPNIDASGSVTGMIQRGYWPPDATPVECGGFIYNTSIAIVEDDLDRLAAENCLCGGSHALTR